jgi:hypothetical protein
LHMMNWTKKDERDEIENQFMNILSRLSRTPRCGLLVLRGGQTFRRRLKSKSIIRSTLTTAVGASTVLQAKRELLNTLLNQVTVRDWE